MGSIKKRTAVLLLAGICCLGIVGGCASGSSQGKADANISEKTDTNTPNEVENSDNSDPVSPPNEAEEPDLSAVNVGEFSMQDIYGEDFTQEMFADHQLTMVNVFATWCSPCVNEIPDLEKLSKEMSDREVNVVGIVLDTMGVSGDIDEEAVEKAKLLAERLEVTYPFLIPDEGYLNGMLLGISAVPTTFFVDREGNLVGEVYLGSHSLEEWNSIVEDQLKEMAP